MVSFRVNLLKAVWPRSCYLMTTPWFDPVSKNRKCMFIMLWNMRNPEGLCEIGRVVTDLKCFRISLIHFSMEWALVTGILVCKVTASNSAKLIYKYSCHTVVFDIYHFLPKMGPSLEDHVYECTVPYDLQWHLDSVIYVFLLATGEWWPSITSSAFWWENTNC